MIVDIEAILASYGPLWGAALIFEFYLGRIFVIACLVLAVVALVKCVFRSPQRFEMSFKRTKGFWMLMTGGATVLGLVGFIGAGPFGLIFPVIAACMAAVYLADVDPEVRT